MVPLKTTLFQFTPVSQHTSASPKEPVSTQADKTPKPGEWQTVAQTLHHANAVSLHGVCSG